MSGPSRRRRIAGESRTGAAQPKRYMRRPRPRTASDSKVRLGRVWAKPDGAAKPEQGGDTRGIEPDGSGARGLRRWGIGRRGMAVLSACALVAITGIGFGSWQHRADDDMRQAHQTAAKQAAGDVVTVFSYEYDAMDEHVDEATELMTDSFAKKFEEITPALDKLAPKNKIRVKATTRGYAPLECGDECSADKASVLVFMDQARTQGGGEPTVFGNRIVVDMVKTGGTWLIDGIGNL